MSETHDNATGKAEEQRQPPDLQSLAARYMDLWIEQCSAEMSDPRNIDIMTGFMTSVIKQALRKT